MPITSKYSDAQIETILAEISLVLEKHQATPELALMITGNLTTHLIEQHIAPLQRKPIAEKFAQALVSSLNH